MHINYEVRVLLNLPLAFSPMEICHGDSTETLCNKLMSKQKCRLQFKLGGIFAAVYA